MTISYECVLIAALLPYIAIASAKMRPGFSNRAPRPWLETLTGWRQRAYWAHQNSFEAFPPFAAGVIIAQLAQVPQGRIDMLAIGFVIARVAYVAAYIGDAHALRSVIWAIGMLCVLGLFGSAF